MLIYFIKKKSDISDIQGHVSFDGVLIEIPALRPVQIGIPSLQRIALPDWVLRSGNLLAVENDLIRYFRATVFLKSDNTFRAEDDLYRIIFCSKGARAIFCGNQTVFRDDLRDTGCSDDL